MFFERIVAPVTMEEFLREYFERKPLHCSRNDRKRFARLYGIADVEEALAVGARETANFALVKSGSPELPLEQYAQLRPAVRSRYTGKAPVAAIDPRKVAEFFAQGYTLVVKDASLFSARVQRICTAFQAETGWYVQPNVYLTPASAQGFNVHYDTHDTLICQIEGEKTWQIFHPVVELPLESQPFSAAQHQGKLRLEREVLMQPGDTLYIPGGFPHAAVSHGTRTLHFTFAMLGVRVIDVLEQMLALASTNDVGMRRCLPPGWHRDPEFAQRFAAAVAPSIQSAFSAAKVAESAERTLLEYYGAARIDSHGVFSRAESTATLEGAMRLRLRGDVPVSVRESPQGLALLVAGRSVTMPEPCRGALKRLEAGECAIRELPGLAEPNQFWLARVLLTYGAAELVAPPESSELELEFSEPELELSEPELEFPAPPAGAAGGVPTVNSADF